MKSNPLSSLPSFILTRSSISRKKDFDFKSFYAQLKEKGFVIYPGKISQADTFRIGNIGDVFPEDFSRLIEAIKTVAK